jgi:hypothetical protein
MRFGTGGTKSGYAEAEGWLQLGDRNCNLGRSKMEEELKTSAPEPCHRTSERDANFLPNPNLITKHSYAYTYLEAELRKNGSEG